MKASVSFLDDMKIIDIQDEEGDFRFLIKDNKVNLIKMGMVEGVYCEKESIMTWRKQ